jgi:NAD(P)-dependent dehydrogenase (short-subunit alcohol dehydrogenase family)
MKLAGKTALVTGAAGLLGKEHVKILLAEGARVICTDLNAASLDSAFLTRDFRESSDRIFLMQMDVTDLDSINKVALNLEDSNIFVDVLVNNAATNPTATDIQSISDSSFENFSLARWNAELNVNLNGAFLCSQAFGTRMAKRGYGIIVNISSDLSIIAPDNRLYGESEKVLEPTKSKPVSYVVSKTALIGLTRYLAAYWAHRNVRVNAISPGGVLDGQSSEFLERIERLIPLGRMAEKDEYHGVLAFLCSDDSKYLTGQNIIVDGGRSII